MCGIATFLEKKHLRYQKTTTHRIPYACEECNTSYRTKQEIRAHGSRTGHSIGELTPQKTDLAVEEADSETLGVVKHSFVNILETRDGFKCKLCSNIYRTKGLCRKHLTVAHKCPYVCRVCGATFSHCHLYRIHRSTKRHYLSMPTGDNGPLDLSKKEVPMEVVPSTSKSTRRLVVHKAKKTPTLLQKKVPQVQEGVLDLSLKATRVNEQPMTSNELVTVSIILFEH